ncbi:MAG: nodulation protein NfeD, partial [Desulfuromonadales bacterium]|nr:nodulation protein NfeD [Desulfuromonadales bacterium]
FILEVKIMSYGMLTVGGVISMAIGSLMLIDSSEPYLQISKVLIAATVLTSSGFFLFAAWMVFSNQKRPIFSGIEGMIGEIGQAVTPLNKRGKVFVHGEYWQAVSTEVVAAGEDIEVLGMGDHLQLLVRPYRTTTP